MKTFGLREGPVRSLGGLRVTPDTTIDRVDLDEAEALLIPGGDFWGSFSDPALERLVREAKKRDLILAAICDATGCSAQLGLLDDVAHSGNGLEFFRERAPNYRGAAHFREEPEIREKWLRANKEGKWRD